MVDPADVVVAGTVTGTGNTGPAIPDMVANAECVAPEGTKHEPYSNLISKSGFG